MSRKGIPNKFTADMRSMIQQAFEEVGGVDYLINQAHENPKAFMVLVGKIVPAQIQAELTISLGDLEQRLMDGRRHARGGTVEHDESNVLEAEIIDEDDQPAISYAKDL
jgi:hypothetical protein